MAREGRKFSRLPEQRNLRWGRSRNTRAMRWSRPRSHAVLIPRNTGVDSLEEAAHSFDRPHRNEFDTIAIDNDLNPLPGQQAKLLAYVLWNHDLKFRRDSYRSHSASIDRDTVLHIPYRW